MIDNFLHLVGENSIPNIEEITFITLGAFSKLVGEIIFHLGLLGDLGVQVFHPDFIPVGWVNEINLGHFEEPLLPGKNGFEMIFGNLPVWEHIVLPIFLGEIWVSKVG